MGAKSSITTQPCARVMLLCFLSRGSDLVRISVPMSLVGAPCFPFIGEGKARVTVEEKEKNQREKKAFRIVGSFFSFMRVPPIL